MHEVLVELWLENLHVVVAVDELEDRDTVLGRVRLEYVGKVRGFGLWRDTASDGPVARETGGNVERWLRHPVVMVLLDSCTNGALEPSLVESGVGTVELVVDLQGQVGKEGRLRAAKVV